ncbi:hypothetical protein SAMD00079811_34000 [Scytonema sp. HK-05]|uniref:hypothetical protein n=1 Tax=Scytonema sp. HK-05 TaxID=1137095 RepID=UPI000937864B|nr:hypothetical protein [Scytonema sp. HK-05]OKH55603.1 hypothetical protein NIES2130_26220 [Scytonema sp. HK-05]BAY45793.1 hypothetical protein SAMD00079811_34000 [Scytonema sp. HK-05]
MNPLFTEITESEATSVVGGIGFLPTVPFLSNNAIASASASASTSPQFIDIAYPETFAFANTAQDDLNSAAVAGSQSRVFYLE